MRLIAPGSRASRAAAAGLAESTDPAALARAARRARHAVTALLVSAGALAAAATPVALARTTGTLVIRGGGDGHGIGMSQYGTLGFAEHGWSYRQILAHYYQGTAIGTTDPSQVVTVLLEDGSSAFSGAAKAGGRTLKPSLTYTVHPLADGTFKLTAPGLKKAIGPLAAPLSVTGPGPLDVAGLGLYRGSLVLRPDGSGGVQTVNALDLEDYIRGVVSAEMPSSWPLAALETQAIAARTYVLTSGAASPDYDVYSDTRSQMYRGVAAETPSTDAAIAATRGQIVTYDGVPAVTYFSASSGGHTESIQNVWLGSSPEPWLRGVPDPYDSAGGNPYYRWTVRMSLAAAAARLPGLVRGSLVGITVTQRGVSPRVVSAEVVGTKGRDSITGPQLQQAFGLMSTYMSFTTITAKGSTKPKRARRKHKRKSPTPTTATAPSTGGTSPFSTSVVAPGSSPTGSTSTGSTSSSSTSTGSTSMSSTSSTSTGGAALMHLGRDATSSPRHRLEIDGTVFPAARGVPVTVEQWRNGRYARVARTRTGRRGTYRVRVHLAGSYRVIVGGVALSRIAVS